MRCVWGKIGIIKKIILNCKLRLNKCENLKRDWGKSIDYINLENKCVNMGGSLGECIV